MATTKPDSKNWAVMGGIALNVEYTRKYGFEATAAARVTAKLVAVPPPTAFQEAVQATIAGRERRAALLAEQEVTPPPVLPPISPPPVTPPPISPPTEPPVETVVEVSEPLWAGDGETLALVVPEASGDAFILDDGVNPVSSGRVDADGVLIQRVSPDSESATIRFANRPEPLVLSFDRNSDEEMVSGEFGLNRDETDDEDFDDEFDKDLDADEEDDLDADADDVPSATRDEEDDVKEAEAAEDDVEDIINFSSEDETPTLSLVVPEKANKSFTLEDRVNPPSDGVVDPDGVLVHPVSPDATGAKLKFEDEDLPVELVFAPDEIV